MKEMSVNLLDYVVVMIRVFASRLMETLGLGKKKAAGDSHFLAIAVALILVVVIGLLFKTQLTGLFTRIFTKTTTKVDGMFN